VSGVISHALGEDVHLDFTYAGLKVGENIGVEKLQAHLQCSGLPITLKQCKAPASIAGSRATAAVDIRESIDHLGL
jgi:hypothetical protein